MLKRNYDYNECWYDKKTFDNGYYGYFDIGNPEGFPANWYSVCISVSKKKRKVNGYLEANKESNVGTTNIGCGIEPLIWAKNCILEFIQMKQDEGLQSPTYIHVYGEDARRRRIYKWALTKIGFIEGNYFGKIGLVYKIDKTM